MENILARFGEEREEKKSKKKNYWQYILYLAVYLVTAFSKSGTLNSFNEGFFIASSFFANAFILAPLFILSSLLYLYDFPRFIASLIVAIITMAVAETSKRFKAKYYKLLTLLLSTVTRVSCAFFFPSEILTSLINAFFLPLSAVPFSIALTGVYNKPYSYRQSPVELGCSLIFLAVVTTAVASAKLYTVYGFFVFLTLITFVLYGKSEGVFTAISIGAGITLYSFSVEGIAFCAFVALLGSLFASAPRPLTLLSMLMGAIIFKLYFIESVDNALFVLLAMTVGGVPFCLIPKKWLEKMKSVLLSPNGKGALAYLVTFERNILSKELSRVGAVFGEMSRALTIDRPPLASRRQMVDSINTAVCYNCNKCSIERVNAIEELLKVSEKKGRASVTDAPYFLDKDCPHIAHLISLTAESASEIKKAQARAKEEERTRSELAQSFESVLQILKQKAEDLSKTPSQEFNKESLLIEELRTDGIVALEALISNERITLVVSEKVEESELLTSLLKFTGTPYAVSEWQNSGEFSVVTVSERTPFDAVFAVSSRSKSAVATGDTHSFIRIDKSKFLMALCDGMGSGESAKKISESAVGLVESFYKAGFTSEFVIENVNRFLSFSSGDSFTAFDILVCDLRSLERSIIKLGSPSSFIRNGEGVSEISGCSLPLGALGQIKPSVYIDKASEGDTVVFMSDGISEVFSGNELAMLISGASDKSVQKLTDTLLERAIAQKKGEITDDMTVIAVRVIKRI